MKNICLVGIGNLEKETWSSLQIKYLLEIAGYVVIEIPADFGMEKDKKYQRIIIGRTEDNNALFFDYEKDSIVDFVNKVIGKKFYQEKKRGKIFSQEKLWIKKEVFTSIYTISSGYANRRTVYKDVELLKKAAENLIDECRALENILETHERKISWRVYYAYLYFLNYVNEATIKLRTYNYRSLDEIEKYYRKLKELQPDCESVELLWANLVRNDNVMYGQALQYYEGLLDSKEIGIHYFSNCYTGEIRQEYAEKQWKMDSKRGIEKEKSSYFVPAIEHFRLCNIINSKDIRILFRLAMQNERKGVINKEELVKAGEKYEKIISIILNKNIVSRTSLEFEYLYKSYIYNGRVKKNLQLYDDALENFRNADKCWNELVNYRLLEEIYGMEEMKRFIEMLDEKYEGRYSTIDSNIREIRRTMKMGWS